MKLPRTLLLALAALACTAPVAAEVVIVVSPRNPVTALTSEQVAQIYTGASNAFPGGGAAVPVDQPDGSAAREEFLAKVLNKSSQQVRALWSRLMFSGKGTPPKALAGSAEVKKAIAADPAALGFIERAAVDDTVKVVLSVK